MIRFEPFDRPTLLVVLLVASLNLILPQNKLYFFVFYRYEAATTVKNMCLKDAALGDILSLLHMAINIKKWIVVHRSEWQPIKITLAETNPSSDWS